MKADGVPTLVEVGPSVVRYAHPRARRRPSCASARAARGRARGRRLRVLPRHGRSDAGRGAGAVVRGPRPPVAAPDEVRVPLRAKAGDIVRIGLHVGTAGPTGERFAWGLWGAPRVMGHPGADTGRTRPAPSEEERAQGRRPAHAPWAPPTSSSSFSTPGAPTASAPTATRARPPEHRPHRAGGRCFRARVHPRRLHAGRDVLGVDLAVPGPPPRGRSPSPARLPKDRLTLAELLGAAGHPHRRVRVQRDRGVVQRLRPRVQRVPRGLSRAGHEQRGRVRAHRDPGWLAAHRDRRFFAYVHFREPHCPYDPPPPFDTRFGPDGPIGRDMRRACGPGTWLTDVNQGRRPLARPRERPPRAPLRRQPRLRGRGGGADPARPCERAGLLEQDGRHRQPPTTAKRSSSTAGSGTTCSSTTRASHVPAHRPLPGRPGAAGGDASGQLADLLDVAPTIADLFGVMGRGGSERQFQGRSLLPAILGAPGETAILSRTVWDRPRYAAATRATSSFTTRARETRSSTTSAAIRGRRRTSSARTRCARPGHASPCIIGSPPPRAPPSPGTVTGAAHARGVREPEGARLPLANTKCGD